MTHKNYTLYDILLNQEDSTVKEQIAATFAWAIQKFDAQNDKERRKDPRYQALLKLNPEKTPSDDSSNENGGQHD